VEVKTHEEDEEASYKQRAKLFTFGETLLNKGSGVKSWNERGVGEVKLLKHKETSHIRVLMRQEKTMKVIANHFLDPRIKMTPNAGASDKSWVWVAFDFAEGELAETTFAIRFGSPELAQEFHAAFTAGQAEMTKLLAGADSAEGDAEAEAAAQAVEALSVKTEEKSD
jgi:Ran-binding protein 1